MEWPKRVETRLCAERFVQRVLQYVMRRRNSGSLSTTPHRADPPGAPSAGHRLAVGDAGTVPVARSSHQPFACPAPISIQPDTSQTFAYNETAYIDIIRFFSQCSR